MLTRREVLSGVAAASIAAIASARDSAMAQGGDGFGCGEVKEPGSALASFHKQPGSYDIFVKWVDSAAEVFYKELPGGGVEVFSKTFHKGWTPLTSVFMKFLPSLDGTTGSFDFDSKAADFFLKIEDRVVVNTAFRKGASGEPPIQITIQEALITGTT
jgi:hypothetical protein